MIKWIRTSRLPKTNSLTGRNSRARDCLDAQSHRHLFRTQRRHLKRQQLKTLRRGNNCAKRDKNNVAKREQFKNLKLTLRRGNTLIFFEDVSLEATAKKNGLGCHSIRSTALTPDAPNHVSNTTQHQTLQSCRGEPLRGKTSKTKAAAMCCPAATLSRRHLTQTAPRRVSTLTYSSTLCQQFSSRSRRAETLNTSPTAVERTWHI